MAHLKNKKSLKTAAKNGLLSNPIIAKVSEGFVLKYIINGEQFSLKSINSKSLVVYKTLGAALSAASKIEPLSVVEFTNETKEDCGGEEAKTMIEKQRETTYIKAAQGRSTVKVGNDAAVEIKKAINTLHSLI